MKQRNNLGFLKLLIGAFLLLSAFAASAQSGGNASAKMVELVLPTRIDQNEPFMFAATGVVEGEVISVQTVEGEVVATKKADKHGRVFLAAGLAAGSYLLSAGDGRPKQLGTVNVSESSFEVGDIKALLSLDNDTYAVDFSKLGVIEGNFPNINNLDLDDFESRRTIQILAATPRQIVFDRPANLGVQPGQTKLTVRDNLTGQSATTEVVFYSASAKLSNVKVPSGAETHLVVTVLPKELEGEVSATILGGPVSFANGQGETTQPTSGGQADFRLQSKPGSAGKFDVSWQFSPTELIDKVWDPIKKVWEPVRKGLKSHVWDPIKKKIKELDWTPPKGGTGAKKEDPPKVDEKKQDPPKGGGGDTKATDNGWTPFKDDDGRTGRMEIKDDGKGNRRVVKIYDDGGSTITKTITGEKRKTVETDTTTGKPGDKTEVEEKLDYRKDEKGEWVPEKGEKKTWKNDGKEKKLIKTEKWDKKSKSWK